ncbi:hypothetical protein HDU93_005119, partial [Gonapodya sp. JEL0774]
MTNHEKAHIARVQVSQLMTDHPFNDDFYYAMFTPVGSSSTPSEVSGEAQTGKELTWQQAMLVARTGGRGKGKERPKFHLDLSRMQEQASRWLAERKRKEKDGVVKEKGSDFSLEGALGKISTSTFKNPKHLLAVDPKIMHSEARGTTPEPSEVQYASRTAILRYIEDAFLLLIELDVQKRQGGDSEDDPSAEAEWAMETDRLADQLWERLKIQEEIAGAHSIGA